MFELNREFSFAIEPGQRRVRLIVYKHGVENVCRKESFKNLERFILSDETRIFKGRLQLCKNIEGIAIEVKGKTAGVIRPEDLLNCLEMIKGRGVTNTLDLLNF